MPLVVVAIAAAVAAAAVAIAAAIADGQLKEAQRIREKVLEQYGDDIAPNLDRAIEHKVGPTELKKIQVDSESRNTQVGVMRKLSDLYDKGGMGTGDEAALALANQGASQRADSDYQSLAQNLAARGQSMSPALAAAMAAKSSGDVVNATATNRYRAQADARERAYSALRDSGTMAGTIHNQDFNEQAAVASAQDHINAFNSNVATQADNENARREMQRSQAAMALAQARAGAHEQLARGQERQAQNTQQAGAGIANAAMSVGAAYGGGGQSNSVPPMGYGGDYNAPGGPGGGAPQYGGYGSQGSQPDEWENPWANKK